MSDHSNNVSNRSLKEQANEKAKLAFEIGDPNLSRAAHEAKTKFSSNTSMNVNTDEIPHHHGEVGGGPSQGVSHSHQKHHVEKHSNVGEVVKSIVFGGLDGIITTFAVVSAAVGSGMSFFELIVVGFANVVGDAFGMGLGDFFSTRAEWERDDKTRKNYRWKFDVFPEEQKKLMIKTFLLKGFSYLESKRITSMLAENPKAFVDIMLLEIENISLDGDSRFPWKNGVVTFFSFCFFGAIPLWCFLFTTDFTITLSLNYYFFISMGLTALALFILGCLKNIILGRSWWKGGLYTLFVGGIATIVSYFVGYVIELLLQI